MPLFSGTSTTSGITTTNASEKGGRELLRKGGIERGRAGRREGGHEGGRKQWMEEGGMNVIQGKEEIHTNTNN